MVIAVSIEQSEASISTRFGQRSQSFLISVSKLKILKELPLNIAYLRRSNSDFRHPDILRRVTVSEIQEEMTSTAAVSR